MTHITEERVIGNHADMGGSSTVATRTSLTVTDVLRAGVRRRTTRKEMAAAQSMRDSESKPTQERDVLARGSEGIPLAPPRGFGR